MGTTAPGQAPRSGPPVGGCAPSVDLVMARTAGLTGAGSVAVAARDAGAAVGVGRARLAEQGASVGGDGCIVRRRRRRIHARVHGRPAAGVADAAVAADGHVAELAGAAVGV